MNKGKTVLMLTERNEEGQIIYSKPYKFLKGLCKEENNSRNSNVFSFYYLKGLKFPINYKSFTIERVDID